MSLTARYSTTCPSCGERIVPGDPITDEDGDGEFIHATCLASPEARELGPVCPSCWLIGPCDCEKEKNR